MLEKILSLFFLEVGDSSTISFWHNRWCGEGLLKELSPGLYALAMDRNALVADYREQGACCPVWAPFFVQDRFIDDDTLLRFFNKLNEANLGDSTTDKVRWDLSTKGCFTVRFFYLKLLDLNYSSSKTLCERSFPCKLIWRSLAPIKVSFFVREASHGKILTCDNLQKKGITFFFDK